MKYRIGLDIGIGSVGWSVLEHDNNGEPFRIADCGCRTFVPAEVPKTGASFAVERREARHARRTLRRRTLRLKTLKSLLAKELFNSDVNMDALLNNNKDVYFLRYHALDNTLSKEDFAKVLVNIMKHRGFKSTRKSELAKKGSEDGKLKSAVTSNEALMKQKGYRTVGELIYVQYRKQNKNNKGQEVFVYQVRNGANDYSKTFLRREYEHELAVLFEVQRKLGNSWASKALYEKVYNLFTQQRSFDEGPGTGSPYKADFAIGTCTFEHEAKEPRASKGSYTFGIFQSLQNIVNEKLIDQNGSRAFTPDEISAIKNALLASKSGKISYDKIRKILSLNDQTKFSSCRYEINQKKKVKTKSSKAASPELTELAIDSDSEKSQTTNTSQTMQKELPETPDKAANPETETFISIEHSKKLEKALEISQAFLQLSESAKIDCIDVCAQMITMKKTNKSRALFVATNQMFKAYPFLQNEAKQWLEAEEAKDEQKQDSLLCFNKLLEIDFSKVCNLSVVAMQKMIPYMEKANKYNEAAQLAGYQFNQKQKLQNKYISAKDTFENLESITSPVAKRAVSQTIKVVNAIIRKFGSPDAIFVELARELSKPFDERKKIKDAQQENMERNADAVLKLKSLGMTKVCGEDIVKYKLYEQQNGKCAYSLKPLNLSEEMFKNNNTQIDHIIPYSLCFDDSFSNKVLVLVQENQNKGQRLPYEYFGHNEKHWAMFESWVYDRFKYSKKARNLLKKQITKEDEKEWSSHALNDTRMASKFVRELLENSLAFEPWANKKNAPETASQLERQELEQRKLHAIAVNGGITSFLRKIWGLKKDREEGDIHHVQDAIVVAVATPGVVQKVSKHLQFRKRYNYHKEHHELVDESSGERIPLIPEPYYGFVSEAKILLEENPELKVNDLINLGYDNESARQVKPIFVSRMPTRKAKGAIHNDTIRRLSNKKTEKGLTYVYTKTPLSKLTLKNGEIDGYPQEFIDSDPNLYKALVARLKQFDGNAVKAFAEPFKKPSHKGGTAPVVKTVKLQKAINDYLIINEKNKSVAEKSKIVRTDVFIKDAQYFLVPVYISDMYLKTLPNKAITQGKPKNEWTVMDEQYEFAFSMYPNELLYIKQSGLIGKREIKTLNYNAEGKAKLEPITKKQVFNEGVFCYLVGIDSSDGRIKFTTHDRKWEFRTGSLNLQLLQKWQVDILGNKTKVEKETRKGFNDSIKGE